MLNSETKNIFELGTAIISAVNTVFETIKNILPKTKDTTLNKELMRLQEIIISLFTLFHTYQLKTNETLDKTRHLEREIERLKNWNKEISHYKLREIGHEVYAYEKIKPSKKRNTIPSLYFNFLHKPAFARPIFAMNVKANISCLKKSANDRALYLLFQIRKKVHG